MIREILKYGAPELEKKSAPVSEFNRELRDLARDMFETMYAAPGVGLAAPQVGINIRLAVVDITGGEQSGNQIVLVNPRIVEQTGNAKAEEGCLSVPGFTAIVERPMWVKVRARDLEGNPFEVEGEELLARAFCHEMDHLDGVLYLNRISRLKRNLIKKKIRKLVKVGEW